MDYYNPLIETLEKNKTDLLEKTVAEIVAHGYIPNEPSLIQSYKQIAVRVFDALIECLRTNDSTAWRTIVADITRQNIVQNYPNNGFEEHSTVFNQKMKELVEKEFADQPKLKAAYLRRVDSVTMIGNVSSITTTISTKKPLN